MKEPKVLVESWSPSCDVQAFAEQDDHACYFYLWLHPNSDQAKLHACFVSNTAPKRAAVPLEKWKQEGSGDPPMLPYSSVTHSEDGLSFIPEELEIVWTMEGSGAGLLWRGGLLAFIPEWANEQLPGFSRFIKGSTPFGAELGPAKERLEEQLRQGKAFWAKMEEDFWPDFQQSGLNSLEDFFGGHDKYFAVDGGKFPPKALVTGEKDGVLYGITLGMSLLRQPMVESFYQEKTADFSRIELGFACRKEQEAVFMPMLEQMAGLSHIPWRQITSLGHGHTVTSRGIDGFPAVWLLNANLLGPDSGPCYQPVFGERVNLLWLVPVNRREYDFLLQYNMEKIFGLSFDQGMTIFDGRPKEVIWQLSGGRMGNMLGKLFNKNRM